MTELIQSYSSEINELINAYKTVSETGIDIMDEGIISIRTGDRAFITKKAHVKNSQISNDNLVIYRNDSANSEYDSIDPRFFAHLSFMQCFPRIQSVVTMNSRNSCIWSSTGMSLPPLSFFHAENFFGEVMCTDSVEKCGIENMYVKAGKMVCELFRHKKIEHSSAAFVKNWGGWTWGKNAAEAINKYFVLEECCLRALQLGMAKGLLFEYLPYNVTEFFNSDVINEIQ